MKTTVEAPQHYSTVDQYQYAVRAATRTLKRECGQGRKLHNLQLVSWNTNGFTFTGEAVRPWRFYFNAWKRDREARQRQANRLGSLRAGTKQRWFYPDGTEANEYIRRLKYRPFFSPEPTA